MFDRKLSRLRRSKQTRRKVALARAVRLAVYRSNNHIYAQVIAATGDRVLATASTLDEAIRTANPKTSTVAAASLVGKAIAEKAMGLGIEAVAFDRSGFRYHGRVKAVAEAAREAGLKF
ncbi:MAG: 50S ribosomal protein L18 [Pseudomonadota bacterium]|jgi:large subunit ribosomal protein L18